jgi:hypothetical protein
VANHANLSEQNFDRQVRAEELPKAILRPGNCLWQFPGLVLSCRAQGIVAESPQDLHWQIRGLGAESPVFCEAKNALKFRIEVKFKMGFGKAHT